MRKIYKEWFEAAINIGDLSQIKKSYIEELEKLRVNSKHADIVVGASEKLLPLLIDNPSEALRVVIKIIVDEYVNAFIAFVDAQPGLKDLIMNQKLRDDPQNTEFFTLYEQFLAALNEIATDSKKASSYFNESLANNQARFIVVMAEMIDRLRV